METPHTCRHLKPHLFARRWISPTECATQLGVHVQTVYSWLQEGKLPRGKIGGRVFIDWPRVEKRLEKGSR